MSHSINMSIGDTSEYTIKNECGCRIIFGEIPVSDFSMISHSFSKNAKLDIALANSMGATLVIGEPDQLAKLRLQKQKTLSPLRREEVEMAKRENVPAAVIEWLASGERGLSSEAICKTFFGVPKNAGTYHPNDPADLLRCVNFLDKTNTHERIQEMGNVSPEWKSLVAEWGPLVDSLLREEKSSRQAPETYKLMKKIISEVDSTRSEKNEPAR